MNFAQSVYKQTFIKLDAIIEDIKSGQDEWEKDRLSKINSAKANLRIGSTKKQSPKLCGYIYYNLSPRRNAHSLTSVEYILDKDISNAPIELLNLMKEEFILLKNHEIYIRLKNESAHRSNFLGLYYGTQLFKCEKDDPDETLINAEWVFIKLQNLSPPIREIGGIVILVNTGTEWWDWQNDYPSPKKIDNHYRFSISKKDLLELSVTEWREANQENFTQKIFNRQLQILKRKHSEDVPLSNNCKELILKYIRLCYDLGKIKSPSQLPDKFHESMWDIAGQIFNTQNMSTGNDNRHKILRCIDNMAYEFLFMEEPLFRIPGYRDHFYHQYMVFMIGLTVLGNLPTDIVSRCFPDQTIIEKEGINPFNEQIKNTTNSYDLIEEQSKIILQAWFLTAFFHDFGYPLEKLHGLSSVFISHCTGLQEYMRTRPREIQDRLQNQLTYVEPGETLSTQIENKKRKHSEIVNVLFGENGIHLIPSNALCVQMISEYLSCQFAGQPGLNNIYASYLARMLHGLANRNHGILSAAAIFNRFYQFDECKRYIPQVCAAVACHYRILDNPIFKYSFPEKDMDKIKKENNVLDENPCHNFLNFEITPLPFLLMLCDVLQDWSRSSFDEGYSVPIPDLSAVHTTTIRYRGTKFFLRYDKDQPTKAEFDNKASELAKTFGRLRSKYWKFSVELSANKLKDTGMSSKSYYSTM